MPGQQVSSAPHSVARDMVLVATTLATGASVIPAPPRRRIAASPAAAAPSEAHAARSATVARAFGFGEKKKSGSSDKNGSSSTGYNDEGNLAGTSQGNLEKKRCDLCLGTGLRKCYNCHVADGWRAQNFSTSKCERSGYVPIKIGGFMGIGEFMCNFRTCVGNANDDACFVYRRNRRRGKVRNVLVSFF
jgi:hypothetical protein